MQTNHQSLIESLICIMIVSLAATLFFATTVLADSQNGFLSYLPGVAKQYTYRESIGILDTNFNNDGKLTSGVTDFAFGLGAAIQADGKILVVGSSYNATHTDYDLTLARYTPDGSLDPSFNEDGWVTTDFYGGDDGGYGIAIQSDGKIVVAGVAHGDQGSDIIMSRYNPDGSLDTSFDGDGLVITDLSSDDEGRAILLQTDGKFWVAGSASNGVNDDFVLLRYNSDGSLDTSFSNDGWLLTDFNNSDDNGRGLTIQSDGKIVMAGIAYDNTDNDFALARYNSDGALDITFDSDGKVTTDFSGGDDQGYSIALQLDGRIVVVGKAWNGTDFACALARYNTNGSLDAGFDGDGRVITNLGDYDFWSDVSIQPGGKIIVVGAMNYGADESNFALARYNLDGSLDTSFGNNGWITTDFDNGEDLGNAVILQEDGKIVAVGTTDNGPDFLFAIARYK